MLKRDQKNILIWGMFGVYLGIMITTCFSNPNETSLLQWVLMILSLVIAMMHFIPDQSEQSNPQSEFED